MSGRQVVLLDMDCFYVQVEERDHPEIKGVPAAVVQYNTWKGGGIIAVNYEARHFGVKRGMRGDEAREKCPEIKLVQVPVKRGKADLTKYRNAGKEVISVLCDFSDCIERASIDEAYIEFTHAIQEKLSSNSCPKITAEALPSTWVYGYDKVEGQQKEVSEVRKEGMNNWLSSLDEASSLSSSDDIKLTHAAFLCEKMRTAVLDRTGFKCSAGIAHNKMLAKLSCGLHKPNQQTVLPVSQVAGLWQVTEVGRVRHLGGKLGDSLVEELGCVTMAHLAQLSLPKLQGRYDDKTALWLYNVGRGIEHEPVSSRHLPKSIGCGKNFQGREALNSREKVQQWMRSLADELSERLEDDQDANSRRAKTLTISIRLDGEHRWVSFTKSCSLPSYGAERITRLALSHIQHTNRAPANSHAWSPAIKHIGLSASKFDDWTEASTSSGSIQDMFRKVSENKMIAQAKKRDLEEGEGDEDPADCILPTPSTACLTPATNNQQTEVTSHSCQKGEISSSSARYEAGDISTNHKAGDDLTSHTPEKSNLGKAPSNSFFRNFIRKKQSAPENRNIIDEKKGIVEVSSESEEETKIKEDDCDGGEENNDDLEILVNLLDTCEKDINKLLDSGRGEREVSHSAGAVSTSCEGSSQEVVECEECGCEVSPFEYPEHLDYHVALRLQNDLREEAPVAVENTCTNWKLEKKDTRGKPKKRGRPSKLYSPLDKKVKTLDSFFKLQ